MSDDLLFDISFHGPFHVARGDAVDGLDRSVDRVNPLPASSLKGVMRAAGSGRLRIAAELVDAVFGSQGTPSPWGWGDAEFDPEPRFGRVTRIRVTPGSDGAVDDHFLMFGEHVWAERATFTITQIGPVSEEDRTTHELVLRAAALAVSALGGTRRRGEGWVSITARGHTEWTRRDTNALLQLRAGAS